MKHSLVYSHCGDILRGEPPGGVGDEHTGLAHHAVPHRGDLDGSDPARGEAQGLVVPREARLAALLTRPPAAAPTAAAHLRPANKTTLVRNTFMTVK